MAAALGGPFAGVATNAICSALLGKEVTDADELMLADTLLTSNTSSLVKLKKADQDFKLKMHQLDVDDRKDARALAKTVGVLPQVFLAIPYTLGYFWMLYSFMEGDVHVPPDFASEFNILLGALTAGQFQILNFMFGSSSGSKAKTNKLR